MSNPTRVDAIWNDVCERNPRREDELPSEWLERIAGIMEASRPGREPEPPPQRLPYRDDD